MDPRWLILHCDDLGLAPCVNEAAFQAFEAGDLTSASVMPVCRAFPEVVRYCHAHPTLDIGVHLTLTSEWSGYRWKPLAPPDRVPSLIDDEGYMWRTAEDVLRHASPDEVAFELALQVDRVIAAGIVPTHLDSHMLVLLRQQRLFDVYAGLSARCSLPILVPYREEVDGRLIRRDRRRVPVDRYFAATLAWEPRRWLQHYLDCLDALLPGVNQIAVHLARDDDEMRALQGHGTGGWNAAWRQRDVDVVCGEPFRRKVRGADIELTTWRQAVARAASLQSARIGT